MTRHMLLVFALAAALILIATAANQCFADDRGLQLNEDQLKIEQAVLHVVTQGIPEHKIEPFVGNEIARDKTKRVDLILAIDEASKKWAVPPMLLVAMAYREGSFTMEGGGALGEQSTWQMMGYVAKHIKETIEPECTLETYRGSALCAAAWLAHNRDKCGSLDGSFVMYATGNRCEPRTGHVVWLVRDRFGLARRLEEITSHSETPDSLTLSSNSESSGNP